MIKNPVIVDRTVLESYFRKVKDYIEKPTKARAQSLRQTQRLLKAQVLSPNDEIQNQEES